MISGAIFIGPGAAVSSMKARLDALNLIVVLAVREAAHLVAQASTQAPTDSATLPAFLAANGRARVTSCRRVSGLATTS